MWLKSKKLPRIPCIPPSYPPVTKDTVKPPVSSSQVFSMHCVHTLPPALSLTLLSPSHVFLPIDSHLSPLASLRLLTSSIFPSLFFERVTGFFACQTASSSVPEPEEDFLFLLKLGRQTNYSMFFISFWSGKTVFLFLFSIM